MSGLFYSGSNGVWPSFYAEMFSTRVRLSGMAIGTQIGFALAGFGPTIAAAIQKPGPDGWMPVAWFTLGACVVASLSRIDRAGNVEASHARAREKSGDHRAGAGVRPGDQRTARRAGRLRRDTTLAIHFTDRRARSATMDSGSWW